MQKIATRIFITASIIFGILGIMMVASTPPDGIDANASMFHMVVMKLLLVTVFVILPSFALSVAGKYLDSKSQS